MNRASNYSDCIRFGFCLSFVFLFLIGALGSFSSASDSKEANGSAIISIDFSDSVVQTAIARCPAARIEGDTLHVEIPAEKGRITQMIPISLNRLGDHFRGYNLVAEADVCFSDIPEPEKTYFGAKYQIHLTGAGGNEWPSLLRLPNGQRPWGSCGWVHCKSQTAWPKSVTDASLELGIQAGNGRFAIRNIRLYRGQPCPVSTLDKETIPQATYTKYRGLPSADGSPAPLIFPAEVTRFRGVMSPATAGGPREEDFAQLKKWGANLIRWQMGFAQNLKTKEEYETKFRDNLNQIPQVLEMAKRHGLYVVLDIHTMSPSRPYIMGSPEGRDALAAFWAEAARRFGGHPNLFGYNLMNEPVSDCIESDGPTLNQQYGRLIRTIREIDPYTPIILDCDGAGVPDKLEYLDVFPYVNIIYSPHMYKPFELTHQLKTDQDAYLEYPNAERGWDKDSLRKELARVREFQMKTGARIYVGEFSCIRWAPGAENYIRDCIEIFEEYGWDWSYHAFREWQGWSVEFEGPGNKPVSSTDNPRMRVLLDGFKMNNNAQK